ncbi:hypothetical protein FHN55_12420 [Streptomyces sp. NP160]|uniref:hypothetical protein n=1 Tax=Streptomyces sp. NP160 TaxID=2586637 RepID=UPI00111B23DD|nr:hypothetical protein [Streptomyces sp. NP160]TNM66900.1 hypothetical protein FHN55_12420 [Streptomyces sp. NP160]
MVAGMSMLLMGIVVVNLAAVLTVYAILRGRQPARVAVPVISVMVLAAICTFAAARTLGGLEFEWDQMNAGGVLLPPR